MNPDPASTPTARRRSRRGWLGWLFVGVLAVYAVTAAGQFQTVDAAQELGVAVSLRHGHGVRSDFPVGAAGGTTTGRGGHTYAGHDIGSSLLYLPVTLVPGTSESTTEQAITPGGADRAVLLPSRRGYFVASFLPALLAALVVLVFACTLDGLGFDAVTTTLTALALAFTTTIWVYAHVSFDTTATTLAVVTTLWASVRFGRDPSTRWAVAAGVAGAAAVLVRIDSLVMVPFLVGPVALHVWRHRAAGRRATVIRAIGLVGPLVAAVAVDLAYNWYRFGSITDNGHADDGFLKLNPRFGDGLVGQILSPGKGLLVFSPLLILALFRWRWFLRRHRDVALAAAGATVATVVAHAAIVGWAGDQAWGARFTVPVVPLVALPLARVVHEIRRHGPVRWFRPAAVLLASVGFVIQLTGVLVDFFAVVTARRLRGEDTATSLTHAAYLDGLAVLGRALTHAQPYADLTPGWIDALHVARFDLWWVRAATTSGWNVATVGLPLLGGVVAVAAFVRLARILRPVDGAVATPPT